MEFQRLVANKQNFGWAITIIKKKSHAKYNIVDLYLLHSLPQLAVFIRVRHDDI